VIPDQAHKPGTDVIVAKAPKRSVPAISELLMVMAKAANVVGDRY